MDPPPLDLYREDNHVEVDPNFSYAKFQPKPISHPHLNLLNDTEDELIEKINEYYDIDSIVEFLKREKDGARLYNKITLQFPDYLICDSATIVHQLQRKLKIEGEGEGKPDKCSVLEATDSCCKDTGASSVSSSQTIWILADTSYSPCCIDEVAAEHVHSDLVIHFGDACLNVVDKLPSAYVLGKPSLDKLDIINKIRETYSTGDKVLLMGSAPNTHILKEIYNDLKDDYTLAFADLFIHPNSKATILDYTPSDQSGIHLFNRCLINLEGSFATDDTPSDGTDEILPISDTDSILSEYNLFHIAIPETPRLLQLTTKFSSVTLYDSSTKSLNQGSFPNLSRRYKYMQVARTSGTIGLLVNTLSLSNTKKLMKLVSERIKSAGKKHYLFVVGKPNVAKLANFENIDIWCILGCDNQGIIIDQYNEYFKPIITPYELLLALNDELSWTGKWVTDFKEVILTMKENEDIGKEVDDVKDYPSSDEEPEFDPVTGRFISSSRPLRKVNHLQIKADDETETESNALINRFSTNVAIRNTVSTSATHLQTRTWTGLGSDYRVEDDEEGAEIEQGTSGVARGYDFDVENRQ